MPYNIPLNTPKLKKTLATIGDEIRRQRKGLNVSAQALSESAGISRVTLSRIEKGEGSVAMGAYIRVISALGLSLKLLNPKDNNSNLNNQPDIETKIALDDYPQLKKIAWQIKKTSELKPLEALSLYERNWRHLRLNDMSAEEWALIQKLIRLKGSGRPLV
jgi:transcriptional regulator with XRE-family HTH domain